MNKSDDNGTLSIGKSFVLIQFFHHRTCLEIEQLKSALSSFFTSDTCMNEPKTNNTNNKILCKLSSCFYSYKFRYRLYMFGQNILIPMNLNIFYDISEPLFSLLKWEQYDPFHKFLCMSYKVINKSTRHMARALHASVPSFPPATRKTDCSFQAEGSLLVNSLCQTKSALLNFSLPMDFILWANKQIKQDKVKSHFYLTALPVFRDSHCDLPKISFPS